MGERFFGRREKTGDHFLKEIDEGPGEVFGRFREAAPCQSQVDRGAMRGMLHLGDYRTMQCVENLLQRNGPVVPCLGEIEEVESLLIDRVNHPREDFFDQSLT